MRILSTLFLPTTIVQELIQNLPKQSQLDNLIRTKAIGSSIMTNLLEEFNLERIMVQMFNYNTLNNYLYVSAIIFFLYGQFLRDNNDKFLQINSYKQTTFITRKIIFIILLIFFRDVPNAI